MRNLAPLLSPRSVAVVGASQRPGPGQRVVKNLVQAGGVERVYPINPRYQTLGDLPCFPAVTAIGEPVDCIVVAIASHLVPDVLAEAAACHIPAAVVLSSGFEGEMYGPMSGQSLEDARGRLQLMGPNCMGFVNVHAGVAAYSGPLQGIRPGNLSIVTQSGAIGCALVNALDERGLGLSYHITSGNSIDLDASVYLDFLIGDSHTDVIALYLESMGEARALIASVQRAVDAGKTVLALKSGRSERGRQAIVSHSAALARPSAVFLAALEHAGAQVVADLDELVQCIEVFSRLSAHPSGKAAIVTISGGEAALMADLAAELHLPLADFAPETHAALRAALPAYVTTANPLDTTGAGIVERDTRAYEAALAAVSRDPEVGLVLVAQDGYNGLHVPTGENLMLRDTAAATARAATDATVPFMVISPTSGPLDSAATSALRTQGIPVTYGARAGMTAAARYLTGRSGSRRRPDAQLRHTYKVLSSLPTGSEALSLLESYGIPCVPGAVAATRDEVCVVARTLGFPVALKIEAAGLAHKSEVGGVRLGLADERTVMQSYDELVRQVREHLDPLAAGRVLVQRMAPPGIELICAARHDPDVGPIVLFGLGGVFTEALDESIVGFPPLNEQDAIDLIQRARAAGVLHGFRGQAPCDLPGIARVLVALSRLLEDYQGTVAEIEINPLLASFGGSALALDAVIVGAERSAEGTQV